MSILQLVFKILPYLIRDELLSSYLQASTLMANVLNCVSCQITQTWCEPVDVCHVLADSGSQFPEVLLNIITDTESKSESSLRWRVRMQSSLPGHLMS